MGAAVDEHAFPLILIFFATPLLAFISSAVTATLATISIFNLQGAARVAGFDLAGRFTGLLDLFTAGLAAWHLLVAALCIGAALWLARRDRPALALYMGIFGTLHFWWELSNPGRLAGILSWRGPEPVDFWWVLLFTLTGLGWLARGRLTREQAGRLLFVLLISGLLRQTDFIENPFSPFFGFAGIAFIAFGVVWDALTIGAWANQGTTRLPRVSRIFVYLGYVLLTVTLVNWAVTTHNLEVIDQFTGATALNGLERFGRPLLYAIFAITLALPPASRAEPGAPTEEAPQHHREHPI